MYLLLFILGFVGLTHAQTLLNASGLAAAQVLGQPFPYDFPYMDAAPVALFPMPSCQGITLEEATIDQLQAAMSNGTLTAVDILNCYLARVSQTNSYIKYDYAILGSICLSDMGTKWRTSIEP